VQPPAGWYSGDTHQHVQQCNGPEITAPDDPQLDGVLQAFRADMDARNLNVSCLLIWGKPDALSFDALRELCNGVLAPHSDPSSGRLMGFEIETSGTSCSDAGHVSALGVTAGAGPSTDLLSLGDPCDCLPLWTPPAGCDPPPNCTLNPQEAPQDGSGDYPSDAIALIRSGNPGALFGYAHQTWRPKLHPGGAGNWPLGNLDWTLIPAPYTPADVKCAANLADTVLGVPNLIHNASQRRPPLLPVDVVFRRVQYLEGVDLPGPDLDVALHRYTGAYYMLLNAAQRPVLAAGTDADCYALADPRTYVDLGATPLTYDAWLMGLRAGRTTLAADSSHFLDLEIGSAGEFGPGDQIDLASPPTGTAQVLVEATLLVGNGANVSPYDPCAWEQGSSCVEWDCLEIVVNGEVDPDHRLVIDPSINGGQHTLAVLVDVPESSWITARLASLRCHTAAAYVILDHQPIVRCEYAEYWAIYMDWLRAWMGLQPGYVLRSECCNTPGRISDEALEARKVFAAIRDYAHGDPNGVVRHGRSTYGPWGPIALGVRSFTSLQRSLFCFNAPPSTTGTLYVGTSLLGTPILQDGAEVFVGGLLPSLSVTSNDAGFLEQTVGVPPVGFGKNLYYQYVWDGTGNGDATASDAVMVPKKVGTF